MAPTPDPTPTVAAPNEAIPARRPRVPATYIYKIAQLPPFDDSFELNAANADFVGKSPGLARTKTNSPHSVPMRAFVPGDAIVFDLSALHPIVGPTPKVTWYCRQRREDMDDKRIFMGESNTTEIKDGDKLVINPFPPNPNEHWGMWAEIETLVDGKPYLYSTADPEGVLGNGA